MECIGGSGVMEDSPMPRLFRESPVNAIWEGSGNVQCLDVLRAMQKTPEVVDAFFAELAPARGASARLDRWVVDLQRDLGDEDDAEYRARGVVDRMALAIAGSAAGPARTGRRRRRLLRVAPRRCRAAQLRHVAARRRLRRDHRARDAARMTVAGVAPSFRRDAFCASYCTGARSLPVASARKPRRRADDRMP